MTSLATTPTDGGSDGFAEHRADEWIASAAEHLYEALRHFLRTGILAADEIDNAMVPPSSLTAQNHNSVNGIREFARRNVLRSPVFQLPHPNCDAMAGDGDSARHRRARIAHGG